MDRRPTKSSKRSIRVRSCQIKRRNVRLYLGLSIRLIPNSRLIMVVRWLIIVVRWLIMVLRWLIVKVSKRMMGYLDLELVGIIRMELMIS